MVSRGARRIEVAVAVPTKSDCRALFETNERVAVCGAAGAGKTAHPAHLLERSAPLKEELRAPLEQAARKCTKTKRHRLFAKNLLKHWPALWTFTVVDGVEPTINHAERGLRGAVIYCKLSFGSQSEHGERIIDRVLSASVKPPGALALCLPHRRPQREDPRRSRPPACLISRGA